ncbi:MAG: BPTD_3080 family restriction endonuclease [Alphaproteobacteria bacterium]
MTSTKQIDRLIINSPYVEPQQFWEYNREERSFTLRQGERRPAGYVIASDSSKSFDDPGQFVEIPLVNQIRPRIAEWRAAGYPGVTGVTKRLLEHWYDKDQRQHPFFFCQLEAIETLIWLAEAPDADKVGIHIPSDGGLFTRLCAKMATGTGKTVVMSMVIAWQIINKVTYPQDTRFSKYVFVVAPGLTVKNRLSVVVPSAEGNYFDFFNMVPVSMGDMLRQGKVIVRNWHALAWDTEERLSKKRSVDKRGAKSDEAYVREVLAEMSNARNILVINDEAHHAWRVPAESKVKGIAREDIEEATVWVSGLDRIHNARGILKCFDFSATPFAPSGKRSTETALFDWIVSDFGLNDAIEGGLVKTPRIVVRDDAVPDAKTYKSRLYHIYMDDEVKDDLNRAKAEPQDPLPDLLSNAYYLLGYDWLETKKAWEKAGHKVPPVLITVANRTETAARIEYAFNHGKIRIPELCDPTKTLRIDSKVLDMAESSEEPLAEFDDAVGDEDEAPKLTKKQEAELLRQKVDTVGQPGQAGEQIQNVVSVGMLSEGWDAKTVTHIMGLRAFSSQLLCEQVVGRGLRRTAYEVNEETGLYEPEYVNIFGVPFTFLPHESPEGSVAQPPAPKTRIEPSVEKQQFEISWPNVVRINYNYKPRLSINWDEVDDLVLDVGSTRLLAEMAPTIGGKPDLSKISQIDLEKLAKDQRMQKVIFETARDVFDQMQHHWKGNKEVLLAQVIGIAQEFIDSRKLRIDPPLFAVDELRRRLVITLNMNKVVQHIWSAIKQDNQDSVEVIFDRDKPIRSTADMPTWYTGKPCEPTKRSHVNFCVYDSAWESSEAFELDKNLQVDSWVKNDHLGFEVLYIDRGVVKKYRPDFIIKLKNGNNLILETKGQNSTEVQAKKKAAEEWVNAVNINQAFGKWHYAISFNPKDVDGLLKQCA